MQDEVLQVDGTGEEGERGRGHHVGTTQAKFVDGVDFEDAEEWERSRICFRESLNVRPEHVFEI